MRNLILVILLLSVTAVWGWTFVVVKDAIEVYGVVPFLAVRFAIGGALLACVAARRITRQSLLIGAGIGVVLAAAYSFQTFGLKWTTPTNCGLITGLFVLFAPVASRVIFGVRTAGIFWVAAAASVLGLILVTGWVTIDTGGSGFPLRLAAEADPVKSDDLRGDLLTLGCAVCLGVHIALLDRAAKRYDPTVLAFAQLASAAVCFWLMVPLTDGVSWPTPPVWFALIVTGVLASAAAFLIQTHVQQRLSPVRTAVIISMEPVFAALFGYWLAGDRLGWVQIAGAVVMVGAVLLAEISSAVLAARRNANNHTDENR